MEPIIEVQDLYRTYITQHGTFRKKKEMVEAVRGISFSVQNRPTGTYSCKFGGMLI